MGKLWSKVQTYVHAEEGDLEPEEVVDLLNKSMVLLGQAINKIAYERRLSVLGALSDIKGAKKELKENSEEINAEKKLLFGETFQKQLKTTTKAQESAEKLLLKTKRKTGGGSRPFSSGSSGHYSGSSSSSSRLAYNHGHKL